MQLPDDNVLTQYARSQVQLNPRQYGYVGSYAREMMDLHTQDGMFGELMVRLTTTLLAGKTISANPAVEMSYPASWQDHFWHSADWWQSNEVKNRRQSPTRYTFLTLWVFLFLRMIIRNHVRKHPICYSKMTAKVPFTQDVLYPEVDMPAMAGRPVIVEEINLMTTFQPEAEQWGTSLRKDPSRFMSRYEIRHAFMRDLEYAQYPHSYPGNEAEGMLDWLDRHGVNVDQLVKRR